MIRNSLAALAIAAALPLLSWIAITPATAEEPEIGKIVKLEGTAWSGAAGHRTPLKVGDMLHQGEKIKTDPHSELTLKLGDDVAVLAKENTDAMVERVREKDCALRLLRGSVLSAVKNPENRPDHFRIKSRAATIGVRGTVFFVKSEPGHPVHLCACSGTVAVSSLDGKSTTEIKSKHHDAPKDIQDGGGAIEGRMKPAAFTGHADPEAAALQKVLE